MMTPGFNSQRGVPYAPRAASVQRVEDEREAAKAAAKAERREATLAHARKLDEIERAWKSRERWGR